MLHHRLNVSAAALAAVTQDIEAVRTDVSEPGGVEMSAFVLRSQEFHGLSLCQAAAALGVVLQGKINKRLTHHHTHLRWLARMGAGVAAAALVGRHIRRPFQ